MTAFRTLLRPRRRPTGARGVRLVFYAFDLLHLDGRDTDRPPLLEVAGRQAANIRSAFRAL
jgi:ATP-dependent DNA ligase